jgi:hypothetical protein
MTSLKAVEFPPESTKITEKVLQKNMETKGFNDDSENMMAHRDNLNEASKVELQMYA